MNDKCPFSLKNRHNYNNLNIWGMIKDINTGADYEQKNSHIDTCHIGFIFLFRHGDGGKCHT